MDYSGDTEALSGPSPWGSSSPRASRSNYQQNEPNVPSSPALPPPAGHSHSGSQDSISANPFANEAPRSQAAGLAIQQEHSQVEQPTPAPTQPVQQRPPQQRQESLQQGPPRQQNNRSHRTVPAYKLQTKVTALERTGRKDPVIRFDVWTNLPKFRTTQFRDVRRTHSEFVKLSEHLISSNPEALVPAVPPSLTSAGAGTDEDESRVKASIQRWLNNVCSNDVLMRDEEMIFFVESDFGYSPVVRMKQPATGVRRKVLKQFAPPPDDTPELHEARPVAKLFYLNTLDAGQKLERVVKARRALGLAETTLGTTLTQLHVQEPHPGLSNAYRKLGRIIQSTGDYHAAQGTAEATTFGDPLAYHSSDAFIVKETLTNRHILLRELVQAESNRRSKEGSVTRLKSSTSVKKEKVDEAIAQLDEAQSQESYLDSKVKRVTGNLLLEKRKWFDRTSQEMLTSVREYAIRQIEAERRTLATLESVRGDIRAIDASGGLSRLGRENNPAIRRVSMASSQTAKGDSWSGVPRSREGLARQASFGIPEGNEEGRENGDGGLGVGGKGDGVGGRPRSATSGSLASVKEGDEDDDRVDARNAASRLAQSTF